MFFRGFLRLDPIFCNAQKKRFKRTLQEDVCRPWRNNLNLAKQYGLQVIGNCEKFQNFYKNRTTSQNRLIYWLLARRSSKDAPSPTKFDAYKSIRWFQLFWIHRFKTFRKVELDNLCYHRERRWCMTHPSRARARRSRCAPFAPAPFAQARCPRP